LYRYLTDSPSKKGRPRYLIDAKDSRDFLKDHFGITGDLASLRSPTDLWVRGVITKNAYHYPNGVTVLNVPQQLYTKATWNKLNALDYASNPYVKGGVPGAKSFFPPWYNFQDAQNMLWNARLHPSTQVVGSTFGNQNLCYRGNYFSLQAMGYPSSGIETVYPTIKQPGTPTLGVPEHFIGAPSGP
jgi:hypothetical protein